MKYFLTAIILCTITCGYCIAEDQSLPDDVEMLLPNHSRIEAAWILPATETDSVNLRKNLKNASFDIDSNDRPWFGIGNNLILNPIKEIMFSVDKPFDDFVWLKTGELVVSAGDELGYLEIEKRTAEGKLPVMNFKPLVKLPYKGFTLHEGDGKNLYLLGRDPSNKKYEIYIVKVVAGELNVKKLFTTRKKITDVSGDGRTTYAAIGRMVVELDSRNDEMKRVFYHPENTIKEIESSADAGIIYTTKNSIGYVGETNTFEFIKSPSTGIRLVDDTLYVLFRDNFGVISVSGMDRFDEVDISIKGVQKEKAKEPVVKEEPVKKEKKAAVKKKTTVKKKTEKKEEKKHVFCSSCGAKNPAGAKFCSKCGAKLIK